MRVIASALLAFLAASSSSSSPSRGVALAAAAAASADRRSNHLRHRAASVVDSGGMDGTGSVEDVLSAKREHDQIKKEGGAFEPETPATRKTSAGGAAASSAVADMAAAYGEAMANSHEMSEEEAAEAEYDGTGDETTPTTEEEELEAEAAMEEQAEAEKEEEYDAKVEAAARGWEAEQAAKAANELQTGEETVKEEEEAEEEEGGWEEAEAAAAAFEAEERLKAGAEWTSGLDGTTNGDSGGPMTATAQDEEADEEEMMEELMEATGQAPPPPGHAGGAFRADSTMMMTAEENEDYYADHMELADPDYGEEFAGDIVVGEEEGPPEDVADSTAMQEAWLEELWQEAYDGAKEAGLSEEEAVEMAQATYEGAYNQALAAEASGEQEPPSRLDDAEQTEEAALLEDYETAYNGAIQAGKTPQEADEIAAPFYEDYMNFDMTHMAADGAGQGDVVNVDLGPGPDIITATANDAEEIADTHLTEADKLYLLEHEHEESYADDPEETIVPEVGVEEEVPICPRAPTDKECSADCHCPGSFCHGDGHCKQAR